MARPNERVQWLVDNAYPPADGRCVLWPWPSSSDPYGRVRVPGHGHVRPHRYTLELRDGPAPEGMIATHGPCHEPLCVVHSSWRTPTANQRDRSRDGTMAKLTEADVAEIRRLRSEGQTRRVVAARFGVSMGTVTDITCGRRWAWVTG